MTSGIIGFDIGGTRTKFGFVTEDGLIHFSGNVPTKGHASFEHYMEVLYDEIHQRLDTTTHEIVGIGIGAPKGNQKTGFIEEAYNLMTWGDNLPIVTFASDMFGVPAYLVNDGNAAAIGEKYFGAAKGFEDFVVITLGTGLGSGIYVNGTLLVGSNGAAGEIGHTIIDADGRLCNCGRHGCLETYASAPGIVRTMRDILVWKKEDIKDPDEFEECDAVAKAASKGDEYAIKAFEFTGKKLGMALANIAAIFDPEAIILSGGVTNAGDFLLNPTKKFFEESLMDAYKGRIEMRISTGDNKNMAVLGAAAYAQENLKLRQVNMALGI